MYVDAGGDKRRYDATRRTLRAKWHDDGQHTTRGLNLIDVPIITFPIDDSVIQNMHRFHQNLHFINKL